MACDVDKELVDIANVRSDRRDSRSQRPGIDSRFMFLRLAQKHRYGGQM
jgi:hypothetical protein